MSEFAGRKYAVVIGGNRITDYVYDKICIYGTTILAFLKEEELYTIHAYDEETGKIIFKKDDVLSYIEARKRVFKFELTTGQSYLYFAETEKKLHGPFSEARFDAGIVIVKKHGFFGAYTALGKRILPCRFDEVNRVCFASALEVKFGGKIGLVDYNGNWLIKPFTGGGLDYYTEYGIIRITTNNKGRSKQGVYSFENRRTLLPCEYDDIHINKYKDIMIVRKDGYYGICDMNGNFKTPLCFTNVYTDEGHKATVLYSPALTLVYIPEVDLIVTEDCFKTCRDKIKYFDGYRWQTIKYDKN